MIQFTRNGEKDCTEVVAEVATGLDVTNSVYLFRVPCSCAGYAALLEKHLQRQLESAIERAHRLAYERGWKDAKGKKAKKATDFANGFTESEEAVAW